MDDRVLTLGNQGALFMSAMTWWDHKTGSIWSQPWGTAIGGALKGTRLTLIPVSLVPLKSWVDQNPGTLVLTVSGDGRGSMYRPVQARDSFVIGVTLGDSATAYRYADVADVGVVNDRVGGTPVLVTW